MAVGYGFSLLGDFHMAQDAAQDAFLQAYRDIGSLAEPDAFPGWFRRIVFKYCDRIRRRKVVASASLSGAPDIAAAGSDPADIFLEFPAISERELRVATALQLLTDGDRAVITLFYMGEHSVDEIGMFLQISETAVKKRLQRARERLKERMLKMIGQALSENAPSHGSRFTEAAALLRKATTLLEQDPQVEAAWLADSFGVAGDNGWTSAWLQVVVKDEDIDSFILGRRENASALAEPLLLGEAPQNAPAGGAYLMALYDGEGGPYEVNWYWQKRAGADIPEAYAIPSGELRPVTHVLFDRVGLPRYSGTRQCEYNREIPAVLKSLLDARTELEVARDNAANCITVFWSMVLISARWVAALPSEPEPRHLEFLQSLLASAQDYAGVAPAFPLSRPYIGTASKLAVLREAAALMARIMPDAAMRGAAINPAIVPRTYRFLDMVEQS
jgi:RNA polymerase sigma factor (sigma-70 family)